MRTVPLLLSCLLACAADEPEAAPTPSPSAAAAAPVRDDAAPARPDPSVLPDRSVEAKPGEYHFSRDMFTDRIETWSDVFAPFVGKPGLHYLEVGVFEGRSVVWMLDHVLTGDATKVTAIDIFPEDLQARFLRNVELTGRASAVTTLVGPSNTLLRGLEADSVDIAYIDGSHTADDVLADAVLVWGLLKVGGVLVFDDFLWVGRGRKELLPVELRPSLGVAAFVTTHRDTIEVLHNDYQVFLRKVENPCPSKHYCTPLGRDHVYLWRKQALLELATGRPRPLDDAQIETLEALILSRRFGEVGFDPTSVGDDAVALVAALGLKLAAPVQPLAEVDRRNLLGVATPARASGSPSPSHLEATGAEGDAAKQ